MGKLTSRRIGILPMSWRVGIWLKSHSLRLLRCLLFVAGGLLAASTIAQAAPPATVKPTTAKTTASEKDKIPSPKEAGLIKTTSSRYVDETELDAYVASLSSMFSMRNRTTDPFGQLQDPEAKRIVKSSVIKTTHRAVAVQATPFSEIVRLLKVTTIMPKEQCFLVGTRSIKQGDIIPLSFRGKTLRVEVTAVNSSQIEFKNLDNGETAALKLNILPAGMTPGNRKITTPGMVPDRPDAPIDLEPSNNFNAKSPNR